MSIEVKVENPGKIGVKDGEDNRPVLKVSGYFISRWFQKVERILTALPGKMTLRAVCPEIQD